MQCTYRRYLSGLLFLVSEASFALCFGGRQSLKTRHRSRDFALLIQLPLSSSRSQIQIATRVFNFVLPPAPDDSPSPSSPSSTTRHFSPSIDITSVSPDSSVQSPTSKDIDLPATDDIKAEPLEPEIPEKKSSKANAKKRKKLTEEVPPPPDVMPPRPQATYAQLCYRAINFLSGKATLQEICQWISDNHGWYRYNKATGWEVSIHSMLHHITQD